MFATIYFLIFSLITGALAGCSRDHPVSGRPGETIFTARKFQEDFTKFPNLDECGLREEAGRGLIARPEGKITGKNGEVLIDFADFKFLDGPAPPTVNPGLWRHAKLSNQIGLFRVAEGIYQLRGFDLANMTLIEGKTGWVVIDTLTCRESAAAALGFARKHLGERKVTAIIITHSHVDHYGGILGVVSPREAAERNIPLVAPAGFLEEAWSENVMVATAMARRSIYQFGKNLKHSAQGFVDAGIGKTAAYGHVGILPPTHIIKEPREERLIDGVRFLFFNVPSAEAPAALTFLLPDKKAYCGGEILNQTMHNLLPVRGAKVRDARLWAHYLNQALAQAAQAEVLFGTHHWPVWGRDKIAEHITRQRDLYKYIHDQTVRLINAGYSPHEIAEMITLPESLENYFACRGYYGDLRHNARAVYQFYMGFYDGNPANLNPLPPKEKAKRYVALAGGAQQALAAAELAFSQEDYRWAAELLNHVVFSQPENRRAVELLARTYEQMGYLAESAIWRNSYLTAADELRHGPPAKGLNRQYMIDLLREMPLEKLLDALAAGLNGPAAENKKLKINLVISDTGESFVLWIENAVLHHKKAPAAGDAQATLTLPKELFVAFLAGSAGVRDALLHKELQVQGSRIDLVRFFKLIDRAPGNFAIVTP